MKLVKGLDYHCSRALQTEVHWVCSTDPSWIAATASNVVVTAISVHVQPPKEAAAFVASVHARQTNVSNTFLLHQGSFN
jgi:hypothetical protein